MTVTPDNKLKACMHIRKSLLHQHASEGAGSKNWDLYQLGVRFFTRAKPHLGLNCHDQLQFLSSRMTTN